MMTKGGTHSASKSFGCVIGIGSVRNLKGREIVQGLPSCLKPGHMVGFWGRQTRSSSDIAIQKLRLSRLLSMAHKKRT